MDRKGRPRDWRPEWQTDQRRQTRDWTSKQEHNQNYGAVSQRIVARYDRPENWYRKAPR